MKSFLKQSIILCVSVMISFQITNASNPVTDSDKLSNLPIRQIVDKLYPDGNVFIGMANHAKEIGKLSTEIADREFSYITPSNDFKQSYIHRDLRKNNWRWTNPDAYIKHSKEVGQVLRIHGPISPQCSPWVKDDTRTPEELEQMLEEYMTALCLRYGKEKNVKWMDVVNETICHENFAGGKGYNDMKPGDWFGPREGTTKWENPWTQLGYDETSEIKVPVYIDKAFEIANRCAPNVKQIINQQGKFEEVVWEKMKKLVVYLRDVKGRRVDGLGWQCHIDMGWEKIPGNLERLDEMVKWCHANNLEFHITEMNVWMKKKIDEEAQAETFGKILDVLLDNRKTGVVGLSFWNVRDEDTANPKWNGTLWRNDGTPRKAYDRVKKELIENAVR